MDMSRLFLCVSFIIFSPAFSESQSSNDYVPCDIGWYYFSDKCYRIGGRRKTERLSWTSALTRCKNDGGDLASINSQEEQDFAFTFLLLSVKYWTYIGLHDRDEDGVYKWSDGSLLNYTNWWRGKDPLEDTKDCVVVLPDQNEENLQKWKTTYCTNKNAYICEKKTNRRKKSPNMMYCSPEDGEGFKHLTSCYHVVTESKSWENAEKHCNNIYNGHLLTIRDRFDDYFLERAIPDISEEMWIGIKIQNQLQQKWTSHWYVSYERFNKEERYEEGTCVARKNRTEWITTPCSWKLPFICEVSKARPPALKQPPYGVHCPKDLDDWRDLGGEYCYYIENTKKFNHCEALLDCKRRGGELASLHSQEESDLLHPFITNSELEYFVIGLIRLLAFNGENFAWLDGSKLDYQNWGPNEPTDDSEYVHIYKYDMEWYVTKGAQKKSFGYICSVKKIMPKAITDDQNARCINYCVSPYSYLNALLSQCTDAKEISCKK